DPDQTDLSRIGDYAISVNGYEYARRFLGTECEDLAREITNTFRETGKWEGSFEELRCCLFMWHRWEQHSATDDLDDSYADDVRALYRALAQGWSREVEVVHSRPKKDPRHLRILDPACGSGHFLLYCFDLLQTIYEESWGDCDLGPALQREFA